MVLAQLDRLNAIARPMHRGHDAGESDDDGSWGENSNDDQDDEDGDTNAHGSVEPGGGGLGGHAGGADAASPDGAAGARC